MSQFLKITLLASVVSISTASYASDDVLSSAPRHQRSCFQLANDAGWGIASLAGRGIVSTIKLPFKVLEGAAKVTCKLAASGNGLGLFAITTLTTVHASYTGQTYSERSDWIKGLPTTCSPKSEEILKAYKATVTPQNPLGNIPPQVSATLYRPVPGSSGGVSHTEVDTFGGKKTHVHLPELHKTISVRFDNNGVPVEATTQNRPITDFIRDLPAAGAVTAFHEAGLNDLMSWGGPRCYITAPVENK